MLRGIKGTYVYACDKDLREYLSSFILNYKSNIQEDEVVNLDIRDSLFENSIPLFDLNAAAGDFSELQTIDANKWIALPNYVNFSDDFFACKVIGESMNKIIQLLKNANLLQQLTMIHFHIGSQMEDIAPIKKALGEAGNIYW